MNNIVQGAEPMQQPFAGANGKIVLCASCRRLGRCRLGLTQERLVEERVSETRLVCGLDHEGGPGIAHGGWIAASFDEILGHLALLSDRMAVTAVLQVEFLKPVPAERDLIVRAWCNKIEAGKWYNFAEMRLVATNALLARANGVFVERDASHFERHQNWLAEQDTAAAANPEIKQD